MNKKHILSILTLVFLSACSNNKQADISLTETAKKDNSSIFKTEVQNDAIKTPSVFANCADCYNANNLKQYFNSINYNQKSQTEDLIIKQVIKDLFSSKDTRLKKEVFFQSMYPIAHQVNQEIEVEKRDIANGKNIDILMKKYKVDNLTDLKIRVDTIPAPILLAQAAIESAYGTSRFAYEGNALFGQWTTNKNGMSPKERPDSKWKVAKFDTPLDSARSYALNMNTNRTYIKFRKLRSQGLDPVYGLEKYSQKGMEYVNIVNSVIKSNNLEQYR